MVAGGELVRDPIGMPHGSYAVLGQSSTHSEENFHYLQKMRYSVYEASSAATAFRCLG